MKNRDQFLTFEVVLDLITKKLKPFWEKLKELQY